MAARKLEKSIAVLPFENYSDDKSNAYFADGIQDDILTALSRISDLEVISRTSVMGYRNSSKNVREIGNSLGAATVLEGSVRSDGKRVRVNVQLINARNDEHIWAKEYNRELTDVSALQSDLVREIANALQAHLSPSEEAHISRRPTENGEAYLAFVEAHNLQVSLEDPAKRRQAQQLYERAIRLDPKFAQALANLSILHSWDLSQLRADRGGTGRSPGVTPSRRWPCNRIPPKAISRRVSTSITAGAITTGRSRDWRWRKPICLTIRKFTS